VGELTTKQRLFVEAYLVTANATESARRAGYKGSENTLRAIASENLTKPNIAKLVNQRVETAIITADEWLTDVKTLAKSADRDSDKLTAYGMLGKYLGMTPEKHELKADVAVTTRVIKPSE
jgi:phage terminase small subunit